MTAVARESTLPASSTFLPSRAPRTSLIADLTEERTCRFLALRFRLCLCLLIADFILPNRFLLTDPQNGDRNLLS